MGVLPICRRRVPPKRSPTHYLWAVLIARIYAVFPLTCPMCSGQMRLIAFITVDDRGVGADCFGNEDGAD